MQAFGLPFTPDLYRQHYSPSWRLMYRRLGVPTLLVRGRSSDLLSEEGAREFLERVPHAEFADVTGAGHMVAGDRNEVFNGAILGFLERHR